MESLIAVNYFISCTIRLWLMGEFLVCMQDHCRSCQGVGVVKGNREVRVDIPAGKLYPHPQRLL